MIENATIIIFSFVIYDNNAPMIEIARNVKETVSTCDPNSKKSTDFIEKSNR